MILSILTLIPVLAIMLIPSAFGHGTGVDQAPPISFEGMNVTVITDITPYDLDAENINDMNLKIRFFDLDTDYTLTQVTYRVEVWKGDDLLARNSFFDDDILYLEVRPESDCDEDLLHKCTSYLGTQHPLSPESLYVQGVDCNDDNIDICARPVIAGPVFNEGGLYNIKVEIVGATGPRTLISERLSYDTFVSIAQKQDFMIDDVPINFKSYYDDVENLTYESDTIKFDMPFDWDPAYVDLVPNVHIEVHVPSDYAPFNGSQFIGHVDGVEINNRGILGDPYSIPGKNVIHFLIPSSELKRINDVQGMDHYNDKIINFQLSVNETNMKLQSVNMGEYQVNVSYDNSNVGDIIPFEFAFIRDGQLIRDVEYSYSILDESYAVYESSDEIFAPEGIDIQHVNIPDKVFYLRINFINEDVNIRVEIKPPDDSAVPTWIKTTASLWVDSDINDKVFINAIQFLIQQGIIKASAEQTETSMGIPEWIKTTASLWIDNSINDDVFINALEFLIQRGIIIA